MFTRQKWGAKLKKERDDKARETVKFIAVKNVVGIIERTLAEMKIHSKTRYIMSQVVGKFHAPSFVRSGIFSNSRILLADFYVAFFQFGQMSL